MERAATYLQHDLQSVVALARPSGCFIRRSPAENAFEVLIQLQVQNVAVDLSPHAVREQSAGIITLGVENSHAGTFFRAKLAVSKISVYIYKHKVVRTSLR